MKLTLPSLDSEQTCQVVLALTDSLLFMGDQFGRYSSGVEVDYDAMRNYIIDRLTTATFKGMEDARAAEVRLAATTLVSFALFPERRSSVDA